MLKEYTDESMFRKVSIEYIQAKLLLEIGEPFTVTVMGHSFESRLIVKIHDFHVFSIGKPSWIHLDMLEQDEKLTIVIAGKHNHKKRLLPYNVESYMKKRLEMEVA